MFYFVDWNYLSSILQYDKYDPLLFSSSLFLFLFAFLLLAYRFVSFNKPARVILLILFSFYFYYKVVGLLFLVLIVSALLNYAMGLWIGASSQSLKRKIIFILAVAANIGLLIYFKYTNFFIGVVNDIQNSQFELIDILLPVGISFYTFKAIGYLTDIYWELELPEKNFLDFCLYISFFANVLAGPIDRASIYLPQVKKEPIITKTDMGLAVFLLTSGLVKKAIIADYIGLNFVDRVFEQPLLYTGAENLLAIYGYAIQIYCDFSGYTDMALGIALLLGFRLMLNFNSPYNATSIADFWRRWHISLSTWLLDYLFKPMQMKFRNIGMYGNATALLITFILCGFWHGASYTFIFWGFLHGFFMVVGLFIQKPKSKLYKKLNINKKLLTFGQIIITFHLLAVSWVFFRASSFENAMSMFNQIFNFLKPEVFSQFVEGYQTVFILMILGYFIHYMPRKIEKSYKGILEKIPLPVQGLFLAAVIYIVAQFRSAELQPFIYFQF